MTTTRRQMFVALLAVGFLAAACGGDDSGSDDDVASLSDGASGDESSDEGDGDPGAELTEWAGCMRAEGIDIPDPTQDADGNWVIEGPGIHIGGGEAGVTSEEGGDGEDGPAIDPEEMHTAEETCGPPPGIGEFTEEDQEEMEADALEFAECMRDEGVDDFPDPDFSNEGPGGAPEVNEREAGEGGDDGPETQIALGPFGEIDLDDPTTASAFDACQDLMGGPEVDPDGPESDGSDA